MATEELTKRRLRGLKAKTGAAMTQTEYDRYMANADAKPGTPQFGMRAASRKERLRRGGRTDLRIKTAAKTVRESRDLKNRILQGD